MVCGSAGQRRADHDWRNDCAIPHKWPPYAITAGPDGALWLAGTDAFLTRVTTGGAVTYYPTPCCIVTAGIVAGSDGALWFTDQQQDQIGRITTDGTLTWYPVPEHITGRPYGLAVGSDGALWFTDVQNNSITRAIAIPGGLTITGPSSLPDGMDGRPYGPVQFTASGGTGGYIWSGNPGLGLTLSESGTLSGVPSGGIQGITLRLSVKDSSNAAASVKRDLKINPNPVSITGPASLPFGVVGAQYASVQFSAFGGTGTYKWSATGLPAGLGIGSNGVLTGIPAQGAQGSYTPQFTVTDSNNATASLVRSLIIDSPGNLVIQPPLLASGVEGVSYPSVQFVATGGVGGYAWSATGLPAGMVFGVTGLLSGKPAVFSRGSYNPQFTVTDAANATASITQTLIVVPQTLQITGPTSLPVGNVGTPYGPIQFSVAGGTGAFLWSAAHLPNGLRFSTAGVLSGIPSPSTQGVFTPQFTVKDTNDNNGSIQLSLTITGPILPAPVVASISPNPTPAHGGPQVLTIMGSGFYDGVGLKARLSNGVITFEYAAAWISANELSIVVDLGAISGDWTVQVVNPDGTSSNSFVLHVVQQPTNASFVLPQLAFGGGWYTALYFSNTTNAAASIQVNFVAENGVPLNVPLAGIGTVSSRSINLNSGATVVLEAPNTGDLVQGWAEATLPAGVVGYAVFRQSIPGRADQEAVVPLTPESSPTSDFAFDDVGLTTSIALVNPGNLPVTVTATIYASDGSRIGSGNLLLGARSKQAMLLRNLPGLSGAAGNRGWATFSVPSGAVSMVGLRAGTEAFTSIPVTQRTGLGTTSLSAALPQIAFGGGWYTALYFSNTTSSAVSFPVNFVGESGLPLTVPLLGMGSASSRTISLNPGATAILEAPNTGNLIQGWAEAILPPGVVGYAVFRQSVQGRADQEAVVLLSSESNQTADLVYDDSSLTTSVAFENPGNQQTTVTITIHEAGGSQTGTTQVVLPARSRQAAILRNLPGLAAAAGQRGWARFSVTNGALSILGLRAGTEAFTSIPDIHK